MKDFLLTKLLPAGLGALFAAAAGLWVFRGDGADLRERTTGETEVASRPVRTAPLWAGPQLRHEVLGGDAPALGGLWPNFRGPDRNAICTDDVRLADEWPSGGPTVLWRIHLGEGHAGAAVRNGRVYVMDYEPPPFLLLSESEITDWPEFCRQISALGGSAAKTPQRRIWELLPGGAKQSVMQGAREPLTPDDRARIVAGMNDVLRNRHFYRQDYFQGLKLSSYLLESVVTDPIFSVEVVKADAPYQKVLRINRTLFEQAFPGLVRLRWKGDVMRCFSLADGRELWRSSYRGAVRINHGVSRTVPAVTDKYVVALGPRCQVACFDAESGEPLWHRKYELTVGGRQQRREFPYIDLVRDFGAKVPDWHAAQCPLIDTTPDGREVAIFAPGGEALFVAVECAAGDVVWQTPTPDGWERTMTHSSIMPMTFAGRKMYVYCFREGAVGVAADDGSVLWSTTEWKNNVIAPSPLPLPDGRIFFTAGFGGGSVMIQLSEAPDGIAARKLFAKEETEFSCYQQTPIYYGGVIYSVLTAGRHKGQLACMDLSGKVLWHSGSQYRFAWGPFAIADGKMYLLHDRGLLTMARVSRDGFAVLDQARVLGGPEPKAWAPMAFAAGRMLLRSETEMVCLDLRASSP
jgi:outer membrane protein assembly factor BamB